MMSFFSFDRIRMSTKTSLVVTIGHWEWRVITIPTLSPPEALQVFFMTICSTVSDDKVGIMTTLCLQCLIATTCNAANVDKVVVRIILCVQHQANLLPYLGYIHIFMG